MKDLSILMHKYPDTLGLAPWISNFLYTFNWKDREAGKGGGVRNKEAKVTVEGRLCHATGIPSTPWNPHEPRLAFSTVERNN